MDSCSAPRFVAPVWLLQLEAKGLAPMQTLAGLGARVVVRAGLLCGGVRSSSDAGRRSPASGRGLNRRLRGLPERLRALHAPLPVHLAECVAQRMAETVAQTGEFPQDHVPTASEIRSLLESIIASAARHTGVDVVMQVGLTPLRIISAIREVLLARKDSVDEDGVDGRCILAAGIAYLGLLDMRRCTWCFRWAWPGQQSCAWHSLSADVGGTRQQRQARYEAAKRICESIGQAAYSQSPRYHRMSDREALWVVARILFGATLVRETEVCDRLLARLRRSAALSAAALRDGVDLSMLKRTNVVDGVRSWLDPAELRPRILLQEILAAERWYCVAEKALPGRRGAGRAMGVIRRQALAAATAKGATLATVAEAIGRHPSAVSQWFRRDAQALDVRRLRAAISTAKRRTRSMKT